VKFELAMEIVDRFHGAGTGATERRKFKARREGALPDNIPETAILCVGPGKKLAAVMKEAGVAASTSAAYRLIEQGAVRVDGERVESRDTELAAGRSYLLQAGKRGFARVTLRKS